MSLVPYAGRAISTFARRGFQTTIPRYFLARTAHHLVEQQSQQLANRLSNINMRRGIRLPLKKRHKPTPYNKPNNRRRENAIDRIKGVRKTRISEGFVLDIKPYDDDNIESGKNNDQMYLDQTCAYVPGNSLRPVIMGTDSLKWTLGGNISMHVLQNAHVLDLEKEDCWVDISEIRFQIDIRNFSPTRDLIARFCIYRRKDKQDGSDTMGDGTLVWNYDEQPVNLFIDPHDRCKRWGIETHRTLNTGSHNTMDKLYAEWDKTNYPLYLDKKWRIGFNANAGGQYEVRTINTELNAGGYPPTSNDLVGHTLVDKYDNAPQTGLPNNPKYALAVPRQTTMRSNNNERRINIIWRPKGGFRMKFHREVRENDQFKTVVNADLHWLLYLTEKSIFPQEEATNPRVDYKVNMKVLYRDVI